MNDPAFLLVDILEVKSKTTKVRTVLHDDTEVIFEVSSHDLSPIEASKPSRGWLNVQFSGENNRRASITLPAPVLDMGHRITVSTSRIKRPDNVSTMKQPQPPMIIPPRLSKKKAGVKKTKTSTKKTKK